MPVRVRVRVERSGGFAGVVVRGEADTAELERTDPQRARLLRRLTDGVDFAAMAGSGGAGAAGRSGPVRGADRFTYAVEVETGGEHHRVELGEGAVPDALRPLLDDVLRRR